MCKRQEASQAHYHWHMPRQNTSPAAFPPAILLQIEQLAQRIVSLRKIRDETQVQWAARLGISQPTMARIERGDPAVAMATYVSCLWQLNPALDLTQLLAGTEAAAPATTATTATTISVAATAYKQKATGKKPLKNSIALPIKVAAAADTQASIERNFAAAKAALDFFKSPPL